MFDVGALGEKLGDRALVELVRNGPDLHAVTVVDGRVAMYALCEYAEATRETTALRFALTRLAHPTGRLGCGAGGARKGSGGQPA